METVRAGLKLLFVVLLSARHFESPQLISDDVAQEIGVKKASDLDKTSNV